MITIDASPAPITIEPARTALVLIDMQRDFLEPGGFGAALGNDVSLLARTIGPCANLLQSARLGELLVIHTREGHEPDLSDAPRSKLERSPRGRRIGDPGPMGRILIRGEPGHDIIPRLKPHPGEVIIDKPGKGAFYATPLHDTLRHRQIDTLIVGGVTTEVCVHTTVREANDRGYRCIVAGDCCGSYFPQFHTVALQMITAQGGIFGWVSDSSRIIAALAASRQEVAT